MGVEKYKKWTKVDPCFSFKNPQNKKFSNFWDGHDPNFAPKYFHHIVGKKVLPKLWSMFRKG